MSWFSVFQRVLPTGRAWRMVVDKTLRRFFLALASTPEAVEAEADRRYLDLYPVDTRNLTDWESQFGLPDTGLTDTQRRDRLDAAWKARGGQDPSYIQATLQAAGFDVYVHQWWVPGSGPDYVARNPRQYSRPSTTPGAGSFIGCGEPLALCGEPTALCGNGAEPPGYPLVNKVDRTVPDDEPLCGELDVLCGEPEALCGFFEGFRTDRLEYTIPSGSQFWPFFLYIGGETFPNLATIDPKRRDEFEDLCLKICPTQQWIIILAQYT